MRAHGPDYEARIERSDADVLYLRAANGRIYGVPRADIYDVDHPGNVLMTVGLVLAGFGAVFWGMSYEDEVTATENRVVGALYGVPGLLMALTGGAIYYRSTSAARNFERAALLPVRDPAPFSAPAATLPPAALPAASATPPSPAKDGLPSPATPVR